MSENQPTSDDRKCASKNFCVIVSTFNNGTVEERFVKARGLYEAAQVRFDQEKWGSRVDVENALRRTQLAELRVQQTLETMVATEDERNETWNLVDMATSIRNATMQTINEAGAILRRKKLPTKPVLLRPQVPSFQEASCWVCKAGPNYQMQHCDAFLAMSLPARIETVGRTKRCWRCIGLGHEATDCEYRGECD